jgi:hypothetical protein
MTRQAGAPVWTAALLAAVVAMGWPCGAAAQSVSPAERDELVRLRTERGGRAEEVDMLLRQADEAAAKGLPVAPLTNKIREGFAKGYDAARIEVVIRQMAGHLETASGLMREIVPAAAGAERETAVTLLAEAVAGGVTVDDVRSLSETTGRSGNPPMSADLLAAAAKGLSFVKEARLQVAEGAAVMAEAVRQGFRSYEILDIGREVKRREADFQSGRASLRALRDAIARGERPADLFTDSRIEAAERGSTPARPEGAVNRPERPVRTEPQRPEPVRPEQPVRPERAAPGR